MSLTKRLLKSKHLSRARPTDWLTVGLAITISILGILMIYNASNIDAYFQFGNKFYFVKLQTIWFCLGCISLAITMFIPLPFVRKLSPYIFFITVILLIAVLIPGVGTKMQGARRWLFIGSFSLQPSEMIKLAAVLYFPAFLAKHTKLVPFLVVWGLLIGLLMLEPDMGTALVVSGIVLVTYFVAGAPIKNLLTMLFLTVGVGIILVAGSSYRLDRLTTFFNPSLDPLGASYHIRQVLISLGSGGLTGAGIGRSRQKYQYLPEASTDSIFAVTAEEVGFVGSAIMIGLCAFLYLRGFHQSSQINQRYEKLVAVAVMAWLAIQTLINLSAMVVLIPLTGVPFPFISYGGSSLMAALAGIGIYVNALRSRSIERINR